MQRNWEIRAPENSTFTNWFLSRWQQNEERLTNYVAEHVGRLNSKWTSIKTRPLPKVSIKSVEITLNLKSEVCFLFSKLFHCQFQAGEVQSIKQGLNGSVNDLKTKYTRLEMIRYSEFDLLFNGKKLSTSCLISEIEGLQDGSEIQVKSKNVPRADITDDYDSVAQVGIF
jgi:hypothetical protein